VRWKKSEGAERQQERRRREDEAPRLAATVPSLEKLSLEVSERSASIARPEHTHTRHIVVASAPALFEVPCHDTRCKDGGHDLTARVLAALKSKQARFQGEDACRGVVGNAACARVLDYIGIASYQT
jgi:hypothetical protein